MCCIFFSPDDYSSKSMVLSIEIVKVESDYRPAGKSRSGYLEGNKAVL